MQDHSKQSTRFVPWRPRHLAWAMCLSVGMGCASTPVTSGISSDPSAPAAPSATAMATPVPAPCASAEHRQFDFWLGDWEVTGGPKLDTVVGSNRITRVSSGCALAEHWVNAGGRDGHSLNVYDASLGAWVQFWIGSDGVVLRLQGGLRDGVMEMRGELPKAGGGMQLQRIRWTPREDGTVVQKWETSDDAGQTWQISFVGIYRRKALDR